ncbi:MAG TPA: aldehyde dehydrogenase family protein, partial [Caulobacteraceae bacterium]|nr:aldehyde dehydrogenase family protein [Caulobacteraceae bacterium]
MRHIDQIYIDGQFVTPHGQELFALFNPATEEKIGQVRLGDETDAKAAVAAAKRAFPAFSRTTKAERIAMLRRLHDAVAARGELLADAMVLEYGAPHYFVDFSAKRTANVFLDMVQTLEAFEFSQAIGRAEVTLQPLGVVAAITPWNSNYGFICGKMATAIAAGCTIVIMPSEMSAIQTQVLTEALHEARLPPGVFNIVTGRGDVVGSTLTSHPDIAKVTFTGSTAVGRAILRAASETMKRVTLELGGKGPNIILEDADLETAIPTVMMMGFGNSGQACIAGTRVLAPRSRLPEILDRLKAVVAAVKVGEPTDPTVLIGPMVSQKQWDRVQGYIRLGLEEGAQLLVGGEGRPKGLERGWFVRPTVFTDATNNMRIAREEIFGPVLCVIPYADEAEAIAIA